MGEKTMALLKPSRAQSSMLMPEDHVSCRYRIVHVQVQHQSIQTQPSYQFKCDGQMPFHLYIIELFYYRYL